MIDVNNFNSMLVGQRAFFLQSLSDKQLFKMVRDPRLVRGCPKEVWHHIALHLAERLEFASRRVPEKEVAR